jgi:hypothetical protein
MWVTLIYEISLTFLTAFCVVYTVNTRQKLKKAEKDINSICFTSERIISAIGVLAQEMNKRQKEVDQFMNDVTLFIKKLTSNNTVVNKGPKLN